MAPRLPSPARHVLATRASCTSLLQTHARTLPVPFSQPTTTTPTTSPQPPIASSRPLTTTPLRPWLLSALSSLPGGPTPSTPPPPKTLRARRLLPYPPAQIYTLIADIDAYTHFLPHCTHSRVTHWTAPPSIQQPGQAQGQAQGEGRHPARADLTVGWGPFTQTYTSRVYCLPGRAVEAVSGKAATSISAAELLAAGYEDPSVLDVAALRRREKEMEGGIFESLVTRWTVRGVVGGQDNNGSKGEWAEVTLSVAFQFANPALGFAVGQLADDKVDEMVEAFEGRARELYGGGRR
ncbi:dehydrase and lipid transport-domain-containing protein [Staphylotrichum tortipilum]|uniref:Dehydrase and lipid transport-domain-containing protein n=1 Tax=Staphylotrichum tortipilum TaxID=2831512 RepID=A0AAN6MCV0_9PEZI|nr:dehydrase and lipid transport-domain-containing protein [Staphylotrichum longicolle]